jgi:hypothetical protein
VHFRLPPPLLHRHGQLSGQQCERRRRRERRGTASQGDVLESDRVVVTRDAMAGDVVSSGFGKEFREVKKEEGDLD